MVYAVWKNIRGAWVVAGTDGIKQYYYYTKKEAVRKYREQDKTITTVKRG